MKSAQVLLSCGISVLVFGLASALLTDWRVAVENPVIIVGSGSVTISAFASYALELEPRVLPDGWQLALYVDGLIQNRAAARVARIVHTFSSPSDVSIWIHSEVCIEDSFMTRIACSSSAFFSVSQQELPDDAPPDWQLDAPTGRDDVHIGSLGLHAVLALPAAVVHVFTSFEHMGCFIGKELPHATCKPQTSPI